MWEQEIQIHFCVITSFSQLKEKICSCTLDVVYILKSSFNSLSSSHRVGSQGKEGYFKDSLRLIR